MGTESGDEFRKINDTIRKTYDLVVEVRNSQLKYMSNLRARKKEYGFILTPDLILQYNYVHQLMKSVRTGMPTDICVADGGITCSNLSVLKLDSRAKPTPAADGSDYMASRIIDLLDRPVSVGDQDLTVNVRDEFAANIKTLNLLFEERYRLCQEQHERLRNELVTTRQQLAAARTAATEAADTNAHDSALQAMREKLAQYETHLRVARKQVEELREINENTIQRNQREVDSILQRLNRTAARDDHNETFFNLLQKLVESVESERNRLASVFDSARSEVESSSRRTDCDRSTRLSDEEFETRVSKEVAIRVENELAARWQERESRVERDVNNRLSAIENDLRAKLEVELKSREDDLRRNYDNQLAASVSQILNTPTLDVVTADQIPGLIQISMGDADRQPTGGSDASDLKKYKRILDDVFTLKESILDVVPMLPQYELSAEDPMELQIMDTFYNYLSYLLDKMRDAYKFLIVQSGYLYSIGATAYREFVPLESMTKERTAKFISQVEEVLHAHSEQNKTQQNRVLALLERISEELPRLKKDLDSFYRSRRFYNVHEQSIQQKDAEIERLNKALNEWRSRIVTDRERKECDMIINENRANRTTIRDLQASINAIIKSETNNPYDSRNKVVRHVVAAADLKREMSLRNQLLVTFRKLYNKLAQYTSRVVIEYSAFVKSLPKKDKPPQTLLATFDRDMREMFNEADRIINFGNTPRLAKLETTIGEILNPIYLSAEPIDFGNKSRRLKGDRWTDSSALSSSGVGSLPPSEFSDSSKRSKME